MHQRVSAFVSEAYALRQERQQAAAGVAARAPLPSELRPYTGAYMQVGGCRGPGGYAVLALKAAMCVGRGAHEAGPL